MLEMSMLAQLVAFADCGTLSAAAEKLHTSQPAVTRTMKKLEEELGLSLFARSKNHLALNEVGELAVRHARRILQESKTVTIAGTPVQVEAVAGVNDPAAPAGGMEYSQQHGATP